MSEYLKVDSTRISFAEYWRWKPEAFALLAIRKVLGWRMPPNVLVPAEPGVVVVEPGTQPSDLVAALAAPKGACEGKGYALEFWYTVPTLGSSLGLGAALVSGDGLSLGMAIASRTVDGSYREVVLAAVSRLRDGRFLASSATRSLFDPPPQVEPIRLPGRSHSEVLDAHEGVVRSRVADVVPVGDVRELIVELQRLQLSANVARGIYVKASAEDVARLPSSGGER